jgi:alanine racemase
MNTLEEPFMSWAEIDLAALRHNFKTLKKNAIGIMPVIKADAYGHGMIEVATELNRLGVKIFGVSDVIEGMELRRSGFKNQILLLESPLLETVTDVVTCGLTPSVSTIELARALNEEAEGRGQKLKIHIKIDTGMSRLGVWHEEAADFIRMVASFSSLIIDGIFTHFPLSDTDPKFTQQQLKDFAAIINSLGALKHNIRYFHAANSMGLSSYRNSILNLARPGLMLYGLYPREDLRKKIKLKPVMSVKTRVIHVKELQKGRGVSYGHTYVAKKQMTVATLAVGYSDGYFRILSNQSSVLIHGKRCPIIGNVTMDQIIVDVSKLKSVKIGDTATVLGQDKKEHIPAEELAKLAHTINYEIVCNLGNRLVREYRK